MAFSGYDEADLFASDADLEAAEKTYDELLNRRFWLIIAGTCFMICALLSAMMFLIAFIEQSQVAIYDFMLSIMELPYWVWCLLPFVFVWMIAIAVGLAEWIKKRSAARYPNSK